MYTGRERKTVKKDREGDMKEREKYVRKRKSWEENINSVKYKYK